MTGSPLIADAISCSYGQKAVVEDVSLTLNPGEVTVLLGASGAGKSTLLRIFAGLEAPRAGEIRSSNFVLSSPTVTVPAEDRRIGLIFQDFALFPHMSACENVRFGLMDLSKADGRDVADTWLQRVGLGHRSAAFPHELSGGEQQRVAIAR
ncbi:MAG: ATP-binding cassette domain-containing protein, partial [Pseudomonadota bacterium]